MASVHNAMACWIVDFQVAAFVVLVVSLCVVRRIRQPSQRLIVGWSTMLGLVVLAILTCFHSVAPIRLGLVALQPSNSTPSSTIQHVVATPQPLVVDDPTASQIVHSDHVETASMSTVSTDVMLRVLSTTYLLASGGVAVWLVCGWVVTFRLRRSTWSASRSERAILKQAETLLPREVRVRVSDKIAQPIAMGLWRPTIMLPSWVVDGQEPTAIRAAIAHELAHIRRGDLWLLAVSRWLLLPLFCNPLYWLLRRQIRLDQELLADHAVARQWEPLAYAELLLAWSRRSHYVRPGNAVAMSLRASSLQKRLRTLVSHSDSPFAEPSRTWKVLVPIAQVVLIATLSLVSVSYGYLSVPTTPSIVVAPTSSPQDLIVRLANGVELELVGIRQHPCEGETLWNPDGSLVDDASPAGVAPTACEMIVRVRNSNNVPIAWPDDLRGRRKLTRTESLAFATADDTEEFYSISAQSPAAIADVKLRLGIGKWRTLCGSTCMQMGGTREYGYCYNATTADSTVVYVTHPLGNEDLRIVALDYCDREIQPALLTSRTGELQATFNDVSANDIREFFLQTRDLQCVEFRNVSLRPGQRTNVEVVTLESYASDRAIEL